jgi:GTP diphosphokinase / guanosine-3',5'-bis(diphosphate) 3'-diphosphatase
MDSNTIEQAIMVATKSHSGQTDKSGKPYILHPIRVMIEVPDVLKVAAVLHDVLEDTALTIEDLRFIDTRSLSAVISLTRLPNEKYSEYINRLSDNRDAIIIKLADLEDNLKPERYIDIEGKPLSSLFDRYIKTYRFLSNIL